MEFEFELTEAELVALGRVVNGRVDAAAKAALGGWKFLVVEIGACIPIVIAIVAFLDLYDDYPETALYLQTIAVAASIAVALMTGRDIYRRTLIENAGEFADGELGPQSLVANEVGIAVTSAGASSQLSWTQLRDVVEDDAMLCFFINLTHAFVLPKRVVRSVDELDQLRRWAKREPQVARRSEPT